ncbi:MAG TPA: LuxR C-terminal-related transcriptional regulator [Nocardioidaceae bacterium]|nr:LuxR C-terminal-related transcriptional regulator [Nocardioidaceae bacterium]
MQVADARPLLMAKLVVPRVASTAVARSRLHDRLRAAADVRLTTVVAPAGWGKTTLLAGWARDPEWRSRVAWLSLDEADDEPVRFWTYAMSALDSVAPQLSRESLAALSAPGMDPVGVALSALLNAATESSDSFALVLDDFHVLHDRTIHESVEFLLSYLPPSLHLVIAGRADPPLPLARMRARGELEEIRVADLRCTAAEGVELIAGVGGVSKVPSDTGTRLVERTEGWPAGLHLAALALREAEDPDAVAAELHGDGRHILDYFAAEVLPHLEGSQRDLLVRCSVLERLSGPLCGAVLGTADANDLLSELNRAGLFVSALGAGWYRCHHLFREVLRRELDRDATHVASVLLGRAAQWFLSQDRLEEAIEYRLAAGDYEGAFDWLLAGERWFMDRGATAAFLRLGELVAAKVTDPRLFVTLAIAAGESGRAERCAHWLDAAEPLIDTKSDPLPGWRTLRAEADTLWATFRVAGDAEAALRYASRAVDLEDDPTLYGHALSRQALGAALVGAGRVAEGVEMLQDCWQSRGRRDLPSLLVLQQAGQLALILIEVGDLEGARRITREVHDLAAAAEQAWGQGAAPALAGVRLAEARLVMATDPRASIPALQRAADLADGWGWATLQLLALAELSAAQWAAGDRSGARVNVAKAREVAGTGEARPAAVRRLEALETRIGRGAVTTARSSGGLVEELTDRELAILRALRGPLSAREIGSEMYLSINTVKGYTKSLYRKLGVVTRTDAVQRGHELGLI